MCAFYQVNYGTGAPCQHIAGPALDAYITSQVLEAVAPAAVADRVLSLVNAITQTGLSIEPEPP